MAAFLQQVEPEIFQPLGERLPDALGGMGVVIAVDGDDGALDGGGHLHQPAGGAQSGGGPPDAAVDALAVAEALVLVGQQVVGVRFLEHGPQLGHGVVLLAGGVADALDKLQRVDALRLGHALEPGRDDAVGIVRPERAAGDEDELLHQLRVAYGEQPAEPSPPRVADDRHRAGSVGGDDLPQLAELAVDGVLRLDGFEHPGELAELPRQPSGRAVGPRPAVEHGDRIRRVPPRPQVYHSVLTTCARSPWFMQRTARSSARALSANMV